jgi:IMP dehydrogenase
MKTVAQILKSKPDQAVVTISPKASAREAATLMAEKHVGVLVVGTGGWTDGIVSERDLTRRVMPFDRSADTVEVEDIMTRNVIFIDSEQTIEDCMTLMTDHRLRHLPVLDHGRLVGMVSIGDVVKELISDQRFTIEQLEHYITGAPATPAQATLAT